MMATTMEWLGRGTHWVGAALAIGGVTASAPLTATQQPRAPAPAAPFERLLVATDLPLLTAAPVLAAAADVLWAAEIMLFDVATPDSLYREARAALNRGDYGRAASLFSELRRRYPASQYVADSYYWHAFALHRGGTTDDLRQALVLLEEQSRRFPNAPTRADARVLATRVQGMLARQGDADAAADVTRQAEGAAVARAAARGQAVAARTAAQAAEAAAQRASDDDDIRIAALNALLHMDAERAVPLLKQVLERRDEGSTKLRERAVFLVARQRTAETEDILLDVARNDPSTEVRAQAVFWLSRVPTERAVTALDSILRYSQDREIQEKAIYALSRHESARAGEALREFVRRSDAAPAVRKHAIFWLGRRDEASSHAFLRELYPQLGDEELKKQVIYVLGRAERAENRQWVLDVALEPQESIELRKTALFWAGRRDDVGVADLVRLYDGSRERAFRDQLIYVLARRKEAAAVDKLMAVARSDPDTDLRKKAVFWLGRSDDPRAAQFLMEIINRP